MSFEASAEVYDRHVGRYTPALAALTSGELSIARAIEDLDVAVVQLDEGLLVNVNTPGDVPV